MIFNVVFDVDGTIWDTTNIVAKAWQKAVDETGYSKVKITGDILKKEFGLPMDVIADHIFTDLDDKEKKTELLELCCKYEHEFLVESKEDIAYKGIVEEIKKLSEDYQLFICSNCQKGYIELMMKKLDIYCEITGHLCYGDTGYPKKGQTLAALNLEWMFDPYSTVYIGDTAGDKEAAEYMCGCKFIYAAYGFGNLEGEKYVANSPADISELIIQINNDMRYSR